MEKNKTIDLVLTSRYQGAQIHWKSDLDELQNWLRINNAVPLLWEAILTGLT